jgi:drug/metabolite transporter (DMT)-like permease
MGHILMKPVHIAALVLLGAIWGASYLFIRVAAPALGPLVLMALRVGIAVLVLIFYALSVRDLPDVRSRWFVFLTVGFFNSALPFALIAYAQLTLTASLASILNATTPLFTAIVAALWIREALTWQKIVGVLMGIVGVILLVSGSPLEINSGLWLAVFASLTAALSYGVGTVYASRGFVGLKPLHGAIGQLGGSAVLLFVPAVLTVPSTPPSGEGILALLALALLSTSFAYLLYFFLLNNLGPTRTATVTFLVPVFGTIWGVLFLRESFNLMMLVGMAVILGSVWLVIGGRTSKAPTVTEA